MRRTEILKKIQSEGLAILKLHEKLNEVNINHEFIDKKKQLKKKAKSHEEIENQPEVKAIVIPPNSTNGDVMMMVFKEIQHYSDGKIYASWWNAKYK